MNKKEQRKMNQETVLEQQGRLGVSMFDPTREHDMNPTRVFSG